MEAGRWKLEDETRSGGHRQGVVDAGGDSRPLACASPYSSGFWIPAEGEAADTQDREFDKEECLERLNQSNNVLSEDGVSHRPIRILDGCSETEDFKSCMAEYGWVTKDHR